MNQPEAYIDFEVYEDSVNLVGVAKAGLPDVGFLTQAITGAGITGTVDAVLIGMMEPMTLTLSFRSVIDAAVRLMAPERHSIDLRVASQYWNTVAIAKKIWADRYSMIVVPKKTAIGTVSPASTADVSGEYAVYYYAGYKNGELIWKIDPFNQICIIHGKDYLADVRRALGK